MVKIEKCPRIRGSKVSKIRKIKKKKKTTIIIMRRSKPFLVLFKNRKRDALHRTFWSPKCPKCLWRVLFSFIFGGFVTREVAPIPSSALKMPPGARGLPRLSSGIVPAQQICRDPRDPRRPLWPQRPARPPHGEETVLILTTSCVVKQQQLC